MTRCRVVAPTLVLSLTMACALFAAFAPAKGAEAGESGAPPGYSTVTVKRAGFSIALPDDWVVFEQTREDLEAILEANPELGDIEDLLDNARRTPLRAFYNLGADGTAEASLSAEFERGVNALGTPAMVKADFQGGPFEDLEVTKTRVAGHRALEIRAVLVMVPPGGDPVSALVRTYFILTGKGRLAIGFTEGVGTDHREIFDTMIASVRLLKQR